jgi:hypothetical protein
MTRRQLITGHPIDLTSDEGCRFVSDCTKAGEGLVLDEEVREKWKISTADWRRIVKDPALGRAIRAERERRLLSGQATREAAAKYHFKSPKVLDEIMSTPSSNPRHRIEAIKELRATATGGSGDHPAASGERFTITINLGEDRTERFEFDHPPKPQVDIEQNDNGDQQG